MGNGTVPTLWIDTLAPGKCTSLGKLPKHVQTGAEVYGDLDRKGLILGGHGDLIGTTYLMTNSHYRGFSVIFF